MTWYVRVVTRKIRIKHFRVWFVLKILNIKAEFFFWFGKESTKKVQLEIGRNRLSRSRNKKSFLARKWYLVIYESKKEREKNKNFSFYLLNLVAIKKKHIAIWQNAAFTALFLDTRSNWSTFVHIWPDRTLYFLPLSLC